MVVMRRFTDWLLPQTPWDASKDGRLLVAAGATGLLIGLGIALRIG